MSPQLILTKTWYERGLKLGISLHFNKTLPSCPFSQAQVKTVPQHGVMISRWPWCSSSSSYITISLSLCPSAWVGTSYAGSPPHSSPTECRQSPTPSWPHRWMISRWGSVMEIVNEFYFKNLQWNFWNVFIGSDVYFMIWLNMFELNLAFLWLTHCGQVRL